MSSHDDEQKIDVTRSEFELLKMKVDDLEESNAAVVHLVAGGINLKTGLVDKGLVQSLDELVTELADVKDSIKDFFQSLRTGTDHAVRIGTPLAGSALLAFVGWAIHSVWPLIITFFQHR